MKTYITVGQTNWEEQKATHVVLTHKVPTSITQAWMWSKVFSRHTKIIMSDSIPGCPWGNVLYVWSDEEQKFVYVKDNTDSSG